MGTVNYGTELKLLIFLPEPVWHMEELCEQKK